MTQNQFQLFKERRFLPYFITQFLGAFNDNIFKTALIILITMTFTSANQQKSDFLVNISSGLFILPFFLFSATAGQLADKFHKSALIRYIKFSEIVIMALGGIAFYFQNIPLSIMVLFLMGTHSTFFGPIKYSILPQYLDEPELVGGNGLVEMSTFFAILLGTILAGILINIQPWGTLFITLCTLTIAILGWIASLFIPKTKRIQLASNLKINWNPITETWNILKIAPKKRTIFLSILGISWFWFYGSVFIAQIPNYTIHYLNGNAQVMTVLLSLFSIGIGLGCLLCERLSGHKLEIGLVPLGAIGLTIFGADMSFAHAPLAAVPSLPIGAWEFLSNSANWHLLIDLVFIGLFGGFYIVPLYVIIQSRSRAKIRSRVIAANNIINAIFMGAAAILAIALLQIGCSIPQLFLLVALLNACVALYIFSLLPEFVIHFIVWVFIHTFYRATYKGLENVPKNGPYILICNHVSFLDPLIIMAGLRRPIRFVMDANIFEQPFIKFFFKTMRCIPITSAKENAAVKEQAFQAVSQALSKGEIIGIFPEGGLTKDGQLQTFKPGIERIIQHNPTIIIPMALQGLWGSFFSRKHGKAMFHLPRRFLWSKITLLVGKPISPASVTRHDLESIVKELKGDIP